MLASNVRSREVFGVVLDDTRNMICSLNRLLMVS